MPHESSVVRARYAISMLRVIRDANFQGVTQVTRALASEYLQLDTPATVIEFEVRALESFKLLDAASKEANVSPQKQWDLAQEAAQAWERAASQAG